MSLGAATISGMLHKANKTCRAFHAAGGQRDSAIQLGEDEAIVLKTNRHRHMRDVVCAVHSIKHRIYVTRGYVEIAIREQFNLTIP